MNVYENEYYDEAFCESQKVKKKFSGGCQNFKIVFDIQGDQLRILINDDVIIHLTLVCESKR